MSRDPNHSTDRIVRTPPPDSSEDGWRQWAEEEFRAQAKRRHDRFDELAARIGEEAMARTQLEQRLDKRLDAIEATLGRIEQALSGAYGGSGVIQDVSELKARTDKLEKMGARIMGGAAVISVVVPIITTLLMRVIG